MQCSGVIVNKLGYTMYISILHGGGSPPQTIVIAWKHFCPDRQNWAIVLLAEQLLPVFALMPPINCLLGYPETAPATSAPSS